MRLPESQIKPGALLSLSKSCMYNIILRRLFNKPGEREFFDGVAAKKNTLDPTSLRRKFRGFFEGSRGRAVPSGLYRE
jgi:hypothetical protein